MTTSSAKLRWFSPDVPPKHSYDRPVQDVDRSEGYYAASYNSPNSPDRSAGNYMLPDDNLLHASDSWGDRNEGGVRSAPLTYIVRYHLVGTNEVMVSNEYIMYEET